VELAQDIIKEERRWDRWTQKSWTGCGFFLLFSFSSSLCLAELIWGKGEREQKRGFERLQK
jgi:hypothetical protein